jgi:hypothetical protein
VVSLLLTFPPISHMHSSSPPFFSIPTWTINKKWHFICLKCFILYGKGTTSFKSAVIQINGPFLYPVFTSAESTCVNICHIAVKNFTFPVPIVKWKVKLSMCLIKHHVKKTCREVKMLPHAWLTLAVDGGEWSASCPWLLYPQRKSLWWPLNRRLGGPRAGLDAVE